MRQTEEAASLRVIIQQERCDGRSVGLVPTMGSLHEGHLRLARQARQENDLVVMSLYVNPTQFGPTEDFERYPRNLDRDRTLAAEVGVDILFAPSDREMYPEGPDAQTIWVDPGDLATHLCGASRPGHFRGVATVVAKLLGMLQPDRAYFGQKDGQQAIIVTRLVRDLGMPVQIRVVPTARESDGLALSSRNVYLSAQEREQAVALWQALTVARTMITGGERDAERMEEAMREHIRTAAPLARLDYATVADVERLQPIGGLLDRDAIIAVAAYFGSTRLIDNMLVHFRDGRPQLR